MSAYPEHEKLALVSGDSNKIGQFLEWLLNDRALCSWNDKYEEWRVDHRRIEGILAEYFEIDLDKIEQEKRAMLDTIRKAA